MTIESVEVSTGTLARVFASRALTRFVRRTDALVGALIFPLILLLTLLAVFSTAVEAFEGGDYAQRLVPGLIISGVLFGSIGSAIGFMLDIRSGFMDRVRSMAVPPAAVVAGAVIADGVRAIATVVLLVVAGSWFGFRFTAGFAAGAAFFLVAVVAAVTLSWVGLAMASKARSQEALGPPLNAIFLVLLFFSQSFVPLEAYPDWAQPLVEVNPATAYVVLLGHLASGGELLGPALRAAAWSVVIVAVFGTITLRRLGRIESGVAVEAH